MEQGLGTADAMADKIAVRNIDAPGRTTKGDAAKYAAMRGATEKVVPKFPPGLSATAIQGAALTHPPEHLFPGGATVGGRMKCVQLRLEAKGLLQRHKARPLTFLRT